MNNRSTTGLAHWSLWPDDANQDAETYTEFLNICRSISNETDFSLREVDRALYVFGGPEDERALISEISSELSTESTGRDHYSTPTSPLTELRQRAVEAGQNAEGRIETTTQEVTAYDRSTAIREYVIARADGQCEGCGDDAPFIGSTGEPYLHAHHIDELSSGGEDTLENVIALCPNCHYRVHHARDGEQFNEMLAERLSKIE